MTNTSATRREATIRRIARLCGIPEGPLVEKVRAEKVCPDRKGAWMDELDPEGASFVAGSFDERRRRQWALLRLERPKWRCFLRPMLRPDRKHERNRIAH